MNPFVLPASTVTTAAAGAVTVILVWIAHEFAKVDIPNEVASAFTMIVSVLTAHFTPDNPSVTLTKQPAPEQNEMVEVPTDK